MMKKHLRDTQDRRSDLERDSPLFWFSLSPPSPLFAQQAPPVADSSGTDFVLQGVVRGSQNQSYVKVPFAVPDGTERVTITFSYTEKEQHTALDLGLLDPAGLRCWSGGNKSTLTVGLMDATPSCLPGAIPSGTWNVLIGVPNIRAGVESHYTIHVYLSRTGAVAALPPILREPLRAGPAWFRGDLHMHTAHSDGQCPSQTGKMVPCPLFFTVDAAARRGLDFIAITDHNASSQYDAMRELQPYFDKVLLIPGREITTFQGHINFLGSTDFIDFRLDGNTVPDVNTLLRQRCARWRHHLDQPPSVSERRNLPRLRMDAFHAGRHAFAHRRRGRERRQRAARSLRPSLLESGTQSRLPSHGNRRQRQSPPPAAARSNRLHRQPDDRCVCNGSFNARDSRRHPRRPCLY